jgi:hypothetical protein
MTIYNANSYILKLCPRSSMSPFEVVEAIQSACVGVVVLDSRRTVVVLRSVDDQDDGETAVIRFRCVSQRIEKFTIELYLVVHCLGKCLHYRI